MAVATHPSMVLIVDDDQVFRERLARAFRDRGHQTMTAGDHAQAVALTRTHTPTIAVVDLRMPGPSGLQVVEHLRQRSRDTRILVLTGYGSIANALEAVRAGADSYLSKPADVDDILIALQRATGPATEADGIGHTGLAPDPPSLARVEWEHINRVLADCDQNLSEAARRLGIHRRSLQRKLQKYPPVR